MAAILQTTFSDACLWKKILYIDLDFIEVPRDLIDNTVKPLIWATPNSKT